MTEIEYIQATNLAKVRAAKTIMRDVMDGDEYGVNTDDYKATFTRLASMENTLTRLVTIDPEPMEKHNDQ